MLWFTGKCRAFANAAWCPVSGPRPQDGRHRCYLFQLAPFKDGKLRLRGVTFFWDHTGGVRLPGSIRPQPQTEKCSPVFIFIIFLIFGSTGFSLQHECSLLQHGGFSCYSEACGILVLWPGIHPMSRALEGRFLTTGPPGKSLRIVIIDWCFLGHPQKCL